jgi:hypothetical protein
MEFLRIDEGAASALIIKGDEGFLKKAQDLTQKLPRRRI